MPREWNIWTETWEHSISGLNPQPDERYNQGNDRTNDLLQPLQPLSFGAGRRNLEQSPPSTKKQVLLVVEEIRPVHMVNICKYPIIYRVLYIPSGFWGFLPSTSQKKIRQVDLWDWILAHQVMNTS